MGVGRALCTTFRHFGAGMFLIIAPGRDCLLRTRGPVSDALSEGQYSEPLGPEVLLMLLLLLLLPPPPPSRGPKCLKGPDHSTSQYREVDRCHRRRKFLEPHLKGLVNPVT